MRTTVRLPDDLLARAKRKAAAEGRTVTSLLREGLMIVLAEPEPGERPWVRLPLSSARGGVLSGVDLNSSASLEDRMNE